MTVSGPIAANNLGKTLMHEHVMCDFIGAAEISPDRYNRQNVIEVMTPYLEEVKQRDIQTFVDCSPKYIARDASVLADLSEGTGLNIVTNTGLYGAGKGKFVPKYAHSETARQLADRWIEEWLSGIDGTGIRPGFIKTGVKRGALNEIDKKLVTAAALTHLETGLTIACHTGEAQAAREVLLTVMEEGVSPQALIIVHADSIKQFDVHLELARAGCWVEYDKVGKLDTARHVKLIKDFIDAGFIDRLLLSHDAGWYMVGEKDGGEKIRGYTSISDELVPALIRAGITQKQINTIMIENPAKVLTIRVRKR